MLYYDANVLVNQVCVTSFQVLQITRSIVIWVGVLRLTESRELYFVLDSMFVSRVIYNL